MLGKYLKLYDACFLPYPFPSILHSQQRHGLSVFCFVIHSAIPLRIKQLRHEANHSPSPSDEVKNLWSCTCTPPYICMVWCSIKHKDNLILTSSIFPLPLQSFSHSVGMNIVGTSHFGYRLMLQLVGTKQGTGEWNEAANRNGHAPSRRKEISFWTYSTDSPGLYEDITISQQ